MMSSYAHFDDGRKKLGVKVPYFLAELNDVND